MFYTVIKTRRTFENTRNKVENSKTRSSVFYTLIKQAFSANYIYAIKSDIIWIIICIMIINALVRGS
jgi:hypothetical protein